MVNVDLPSQDIENGTSTTLDTMTPADLANEAFNEWISLKVDWSTWLLNEQKLDEINKNKHIDSAFQQNMGNTKFEMLLIFAFNKAFIKNMESEDLFMVDNLIVLLRSAVNAIEAATNIIKYFDLESDVEDDETDKGMEMVAILKSTAHDIQQ
ncbi:unnamed protein product [Sphagnum jensenii]|uniref:Uncharacterized protein n=1 Tax=Sphagnum jensenii TaxID=128206 RepID=A0ABP1C168_9BRYO